MADGVAIALIVTAVILIFAVAALIAWAVSARTTNDSKGQTGTTLLPCSEYVDISTLQQIPSTGADCVQSGATGLLFYIGGLSGGTYDYVVAPWGTLPIDVCVGFCTGLSGTVCSGPNYKGLSAQTNFNNCMAQLTPTNCLAPLPIAAVGNSLYYAYSPTCNKCDNCS